MRYFWVFSILESSFSGRMEQSEGVMLLRPGDHLRRYRSRLGMTTRQVEEISKAISVSEGNDEFFISHARIVQVENDESTPSIYKLFSLSAIYGVKLTDLLGMYLDFVKLAQYQISGEHLTTRPLGLEEPVSVHMSFPIRFDPGFGADRTSFLTRLVEVWGEVPTAALQQLRLRNMRYGFIGLEDYTLYPMLRPGSFVQIDDSRRKVAGGPYRHETERPIYFLELRDAYVCAWCEVHKNRLIAIPHPLSPCRVREFAYPDEVDILGQVTAVAARLVDRRTQEAHAPLNVGIAQARQSTAT